MQLLSQLGRGAAGQLGDLGAMAGGQLGGPTAEDVRLVEESIGTTRDIAQRQAQQALSQLGAQTREQMAGRGIQGSSIEGLQNVLNQAFTQQQLMDMIQQSQLQGGQALMNLPFQRAGLQLSANQALFNRIVGASQPSLANLLQSRLAQTTRTEKHSGGQLGQFLQLGQSLGSMGLGFGQGQLFGSPQQQQPLTQPRRVDPITYQEY